MKKKMEITKRKLAGYDLPCAHSLTGHAVTMVQQLESLSHIMEGITPPAGGEPRIEPTDMRHTMALFSENLGRVRDLIEDIARIMEEVDPSLQAAVNE